MNWINIKAILKKQCKDTLKNKAVLLQFIMFPLMTLIMSNMIHEVDLGDDFFVKMFGSMYIGMAPLVAAASIIAEEKETNTLRMLLFSNVKASQYLIGIGLYIFILCLLGSMLIGSVGGYTLRQYLNFISLSALGIIISIIIGALIGMFARNQMSATSITIPVMMVLSFVPMLSMFNDIVKNIGEFIYTQRINQMFEQLATNPYTFSSIAVLALSACISLALFIVLFHKKHTLL